MNARMVHPKSKREQETKTKHIPVIRLFASSSRHILLFLLFTNELISSVDLNDEKEAVVMASERRLKLALDDWEDSKITPSRSLL